MKLKFLPLCFILFQPFAYAQEGYNFNLQECIDFAYNNQLKIKNAELDKRIAENKVRETIGIGLPQLNAGASFQHFFDIPTTYLPDFISPATYGVLSKEGVRDSSGNRIQTPQGDPRYFPAKFGVENSLGLSLEFSQIIFSGEYLLGLKAASVYTDLTRKNYERTKIETAVTVTKAYYTVLVNEERLSLLEANIRRLQKLSDDTRALYQNGFVEKIDNDRITVLLNNLKVEKDKVEKMVKLTYQLLKFQMGMKLNATFTLKDKLSAIEFQPILSASSGAANMENRIEYSMLQTQKRLMELDYKRNKVSYAPSVIGFGSIGKSGQDNTLNNLFDGTTTYYPTSIIGVKISMPVLGGGQKYFRTRQAKLNLMKSENDLANIKNAIALEQNQAQINYQGSVESMETQKKNMELAGEVFRVSKVKYDQGIGSNLEVVTAETSLKEAQTNYISSLYDALIAKIEMDRALGNIR